MTTPTDEEANAVWDVLVEHAGASEGQRDEFLVNADRWTEFRFQGALGFGGKVWRDLKSHLPVRYYVTCYPEDMTAERRRVLGLTNDALGTLHDEVAEKAQL